MSVNYQKELEKELGKLNGNKKSLLLHACCAPCSSYVLEYLSAYFNITLFYYNPNISPQEEYTFRAAEACRLAGEMLPDNKIKFLEGPYNPADFYNAVKGLESEPEGGKRCEKCFNLRLNKTAEICREQGFDYFTTTLTISPLKNAELLNASGMHAAEKYGVTWLPCDFKKRGGYKRSVELSKQYNLYRQNYCGCIFSKSAK